MNPNKQLSSSYVEMNESCKCVFIVDDGSIDFDNLIIIVYLPETTQTLFEVDCTSEITAWTDTLKPL